MTTDISSSNSPNDFPSDLPSNSPSNLPSNLPESLPSSLPSDLSSSTVKNSPSSSAKNSPNNPSNPILAQLSRNNPWIGALLIVLGLAAIALPAVSTIFVETWIALILISAGAAKLAYAFQTRAAGGFLWKVLLSILYVATGIMLFFYPSTGILTLTLLLGSFLLTEGLFELILAFQLRPQQNWLWVLGDGIVTLALGAMIWFHWPFDAAWVIGTLVGFSILFTGISRVMLALNKPALEQTASTPSA